MSIQNVLGLCMCVFDGKGITLFYNKFKNKQDNLFCFHAANTRSRER